MFKQFKLAAMFGRASIGENEHAFVQIETTGKGTQVARPARSAVTIPEQTLVRGKPLTARVSVPVIKEYSDGTMLVEVRVDSGKTRRFTVTTDGRIITS